MKSYINISGKEYEIKYVTDLSFEDYNKLEHIRTNSKDPVKICKYVLMMLCGVEKKVLDTVELESLLLLPYNEILNRERPHKEVKDKLGDYTLIEIDTMLMNRFIDLDDTITSTNYKIEEIVSLMLLPDGYEPDSFQICVSYVKKHMSVGDALQLFNRYVEYREIFYDVYSGLFGSTKENKDESNKELDENKDEDTSINRWGLKGLIYSLTNGDLSKVDKYMNTPHLDVFEYSSYQKEINDYIREEQKLQK